MVFEPSDPSLGPEITYSTQKSRKSFRLPRPNKENSPLAIESFAQDPASYADLMQRVDEYLVGLAKEPTGE